MSVNSKMTAIADNIRSITGTTGAMGLDSMANNLATAKANLDNSYSAIGNKGGTLPEIQSIHNLPVAIQSIPEGVELNFEIVGGTTAPANPKVNTVWINTDIPIADVVFSSGQAVSKEGRVWVAIGTTSPGSFQPIAGGTNGCWIYIYPLQAKQYIDGAWVIKQAKTWKNDAWVDWRIYIYNKGEPSCTFARKAIRPNSSFTSPAELPTIAAYGTHYHISNVGGSSSGSCGVAYVDYKIDLTNVSTLYVEGDFYPPSYNYRTYPYIGIWSAFGTYAADNLIKRVSPCSEAGAEITTIATIPVDDLTGEYYIGFCFYAQTNTECGITVRRIYLE